MRILFVLLTMLLLDTCVTAQAQSVAPDYVGRSTGKTVVNTPSGTFTVPAARPGTSYVRIHDGKPLSTAYRPYRLPGGRGHSLHGGLGQGHRSHR